MLLAFAVARLWPDVLSNALEPGWVPTKMGGADAPDDLDQGHRTQTWLAVSDEPEAKVSGENFYHQLLRNPLPATRRSALQQQLMEACAFLSGVAFPANANEGEASE